ncbi:MAG: hypothetical protein GF308_09505 [Candidatus Heimdallarchaeota archaeon]|nr:hypothetical protein [Candidatus Heimdallarchaeota archaeon]
MSTERLRKQLQKALKKLEKKYSIIFALLFGSHAREEEHPRDIDIGVYLSKTIDRKEYLRIRLKLLADLSESLQRDDLDLIILNESPPRLRYSVIKEGKIILNTDENSFMEFYLRTMSQYLDIKYYLEQTHQQVLKEIKEEG